MDENTLQTNINRVKEMILDEEKLVTYVSLSRELCIHINESKSIMNKVLEDIKKNGQDLAINVSFILSGISDNNQARTIVASEAEIDTQRKAFKNVFFVHIYSLSMGRSTVDPTAFLAINNFEDFPLCTGLIKSSSCVKRTTDEIENLKTNNTGSVLSEQKPTNPLLKKMKEESNDIRDEKVQSVSKIQGSKSEPVIKKEISSPKKDVPNSSKLKPDINKIGTKSQKGIAGFFSKSNSAPSKNSIKNITETKKDEAFVKSENYLVKQKINEVKVENMDIDEEVKAEKEVIKKEIKENAKNGNKSLNYNKKKPKIDKKRKRLFHISDSESDEEKNDPFAEETAPNNESDDEIPPTPSLNTVKITSGIVNPKKRRKIVDKTYTDEEGYILTKKVEIYESGSDNEEGHAKENIQTSQANQDTSPKEKKTETKNNKKKISPPQKGKQVTLMNFFKKV